jgi:tRNA G10  N-methylase Trm11
MLDGIEQVAATRNGGKVIAVANIGDARQLPTEREYDAVICSPPYPNRHDYTRIYSLEMVFDFIASNEELKRVRYDTMRSHVEARKKYEAPGYQRPPIVDDCWQPAKVGHFC